MDKKEEMLLRELASGHCTIHKVTQALGPLSLWSKDSFERELQKAKAKEREEILEMSRSQWFKTQADFEEAIRARGQ